jgi:hypothetical protein
MNNPIETNSFRHFLEIGGVETEIIEPTNFDQSNFKVVQDDIARDTYYGNEESQLEFAINYGAPIGSYMNNEGVLVYHLQSGVELLIEENKNYGNEADVKYILKKNGVSFTTGNIDFNKDFETDNETYVKCRVIQNNNQALIKKREDIIIDLLSDKDLDDNTITPIPVQRMFLKAKPTYSGSKWENFNLENKVYNHFGQDSFYIPLSNSQLTEYAIDNSFVQFESYYTPPLSSNDEVREIRRGARMIVAKEDLSNIKIKINKLTAFINASGTVQCGLIIQYGAGYFSTESTIVNIVPNSFGGFSVTNLDYELTIPSLPSGQHIIISFTTFVPNFPTGAILGNATVNASCESIEITATSTAISSVINAVRWIDLIKQNYKAIGSLPVDAEKYDVGGEFYDNFLFTKNLIKQNTTSPFYLKLKDTKEHLLEQCAYAQINNDKIYIGQYPDFYRNIDMGGFLELPTYDSSITKNIKYLVNKFVFGYEKYEQDRNERNTVDAIHTDSEWFPQAKNSINTKSFKLPFIRDPFSIETARKSVFSINNNSDSTDDNIFIADVTLLPPNSRNKFTRLLTWQTNGTQGTTKIVSDNTFSWDQLGFNVGDTIIETGVSRVVLEITPSILTLSFSGADGTGTNFTTIDYPLTNVLYTNRTNEGLIFSENLRNSDNFGNLRYSTKRNKLHWRAVEATYGKFIPTKKIKNTYFKANGECTTQFVGEPLPIKENEDILISDIASKKILNQDIYKTSVTCGFEQAVQLLNDIQNVRGFIRVQNPSGAIVKGYIKEANYLWNNEELELELEVKNESDFLNVTFSGGLLRINEVGYDEKTANVKNYNIFNDFIQFFDNNSINLCNRTKFDKVQINGITYNNIDNLINAIESL